MSNRKVALKFNISSQRITDLIISGRQGVVNSSNMRLKSGTLKVGQQTALAVSHGIMMQV